MRKLFALWHDNAYLQAAKQIRGYLKNFLTSPEGAFYTSQEADLVRGEHGGEYFQLSDAGRRQRGVPRIDTHIYARENGWAINALATLYAVTGEQDYLDDTIRAANWIIVQRALPGGGFRHDEKDPAGPYLGDTLFMGRAFLTLYAVTADRAWLRRAEEAVQFISADFKADIGYITSAGAAELKSKPQVDENVWVTRLANLLHQYTNKVEYTQIAEHAMRFLSAPGVADRAPMPGINGKLGKAFIGVSVAFVNRSSPNRDLVKEFLEKYALTKESLCALDHVKPIGIPAMISLDDELSQNNPLLGEMKRCVDEGEVMPNIPQMGGFWRCMAAALEIATSGRSGPAAALEDAQREMLKGIQDGRQ